LDGPPYLFQGEDKVVHAALYATLGATLMWGRARAASPPPVWVLVSLGVLYGASDEWHQMFVAGRDPSVGDWVADTVGVLLGYWLSAMMVRNVSPPDGALRHYETTPATQPE
jgi:VanZ family protein